jgi:hypothetical protein
MVTLPAESEERIVRYLLDEKGEEERLQQEDRLFHEPEFFELVHSVEDELILKFVRGDLESQPAARFSEVYMNEPAKRARVESARAWRQAAGEVAAASKSSPAARLWVRLSVYATAAVILFAVLVLLQLHRKQPLQQFVQISETPSASFVTFVLEPGLTRSEGERGVEIKVPPGTELVRLELTLPYPGKAETYHVVVGTPERPAVWDGAASRKDATVVVSVPVKALLAGDYTLELQADGKDVATYCFRVAK